MRCASVAQRAITLRRVGNATTYAFDALNRLTSITSPDPDGGGAQSAHDQLRLRLLRQRHQETAASVDHLFAFTGRERDEESDLQYNRAPYHDAAGEETKPLVFWLASTTAWICDCRQEGQPRPRPPDAR